MNKSDDLISRQAAIDGKISVQRTNGVEIYSDDVVPVTYLENLPSAQPEIIRCKDCKHWREGTVYSYCDKLYGMGVLDAYDYMTAEDDFCSHAERRSK